MQHHNSKHCFSGAGMQPVLEAMKLWGEKPYD
jgi:hypothetical protein